MSKAFKDHKKDMLDAINECNQLLAIAKLELKLGTPDAILSEHSAEQLAVFVEQLTQIAAQLDEADMHNDFSYENIDKQLTVMKRIDVLWFRNDGELSHLYNADLYASQQTRYESIMQSVTYLMRAMLHLIDIFQKQFTGELHDNQRETPYARKLLGRGQFFPPPITSLNVAYAEFDKAVDRLNVAVNVMQQEDVDAAARRADDLRV